MCDILDNQYSTDDLKQIFKPDLIKEILKTENYFSIIDKKNNFSSLDEYKEINVILKKNMNLIKNEFVKEEIDKSLNKKEILRINELIKIYNNKILKKINDFNNEIKSYNSSLDGLNELKDAINVIKRVLGNNFKQTEDITKWIEEGIRIHKYYGIISNCIYCGNKGLSFVEKHKIVLENKIMKFKNKIISLKKKNIDFLETELLKPLKKFNKSVTLDKLNEKVKNLFDYLKLLEINDKNIELVPISTLQKINLIQINNINLDLLKQFLIINDKNYVLKEIQKTIFKKKLDEKYNELNKKVSSIIKKNIGYVSKTINSNKLFLGINTEVEVKFYKAPGSTKDKKYRLVFKKNNKNLVQSISDGQKFKFAVMLFIEEIRIKIEKLKNKNNFLLIFDDPIDTADMFTYFSFKSLIINKLFKNYKNKIKIIILTHNIDYSTIQFNTSEDKLAKMEFIRMYEKKCSDMEYTELFINDKIMFLQLHEKLIGSLKNNNGKLYFNIPYLVIYLTLVRKFIEQFLKEIYTTIHFKKILTVGEKNLNEFMIEINKNIKNCQIQTIIKKIKAIIKALDKKWLKNKELTVEEIWNIIVTVIKINKFYFLSPTDNEKNILENKNQLVIDDKSKIDYKFRINYLNEIKFSKWDDKKYLLAAKVFAKKHIKQSSELEFIKAFLRHPNSNFYKPFIAIDEEILLKIIDN